MPFTNQLYIYGRQHSDPNKALIIIVVSVAVFMCCFAFVAFVFRRRRLARERDINQYYNQDTVNPNPYANPYDNNSSQGFNNYTNPNTNTNTNTNININPNYPPPNQYPNNNSQGFNTNNTNVYQPPRQW